MEMSRLRLHALTLLDFPVAPHRHPRGASADGRLHPALLPALPEWDLSSRGMEVVFLHDFLPIPSYRKLFDFFPPLAVKAQVISFLFLMSEF